MDRIVVVGGGLTGSFMPETLQAHMTSVGGEYEVVFIDHDVVEPRNSPSNHPVKALPADKDSYKARLLSNKMIDGGFKSKSYVQKLTEKNAGNLLGKATVVVGCVDNVAARNAMWHYCMDNEIPLLDVGIGDTNLNVAWVNRNGKRIVDTSQFSPADGEIPEVVDEKDPPCYVVASRMTAAIAVEAAVKSLFLFLKAHDPWSMVNALANRDVENGDMVGWNGVFASNAANLTPQFQGNVVREGS